MRILANTGYVRVNEPKHDPIEEHGGKDEYRKKLGWEIRVMESCSLLRGLIRLRMDTIAIQVHF